MKIITFMTDCMKDVCIQLISWTLEAETPLVWAELLAYFHLRSCLAVKS